MHRLAKIFIFLFIVSLPWQTRWIFFDASLGGQVWEYGRLSFYGSMIILLAALVVNFFSQKPRLAWSKNKWLYIFLFYLVLISIFSSWPLISFYYLGLVILALLFALLSKKFSWDFLSLAWLISGTGQAVLAIGQFFSQKISADKWLGLAEHLAKDPGASVVQVGDQRWLRAYGALTHPNVLGGFLLVSIVASVYWWQKIYQAGENSQWSREFMKKSWWHLIIVIIALVLQTAGLALTFSRGALLALLVFILLIFIFSLKNKLNLWRQIIIKYFVLLILSILLINYFLPNAWLNRIESRGRLEDISTSQRISSWQQINWRNPKEVILGQGLGTNTFVAWAKSEQKHKMSYDFQPIHNIYLLALGEIGLIGFLSLVFLLWRFFRKKIKPDFFGFSLLISVLALGLFDHYLWTSWVGLCILFFAIINFSRQFNK
ncbi:MAG: O-antigen ligase family protein [Patescibacteria group bacterium]